MSHYSYRAIAKCELDGVENADQATLLIVQTALTSPTLKHAIPDDLAGDDSDDLFAEVRQYIKVSGLGQVVVSFDTDEGNFCRQFFDYITSVLATIHTGDYLEINWSGWDSREGLSGGCDRYGPGGILLEPANDTRALDKIAQILSESNWDQFILAEIYDVVTETHRKVNLEN